MYVLVTCPGWSSFGSAVGLDDLWRLFSTPTTLRFSFFTDIEVPRSPSQCSTIFLSTVITCCSLPNLWAGYFNWSKSGQFYLLQSKLLTRLLVFLAWRGKWPPNHPAFLFLACSIKLCMLMCVGEGEVTHSPLYTWAHTEATLDVEWI